MSILQGQDKTWSVPEPWTPVRKKVHILTFPGKGLKDEGLKYLPKGLHLEDRFTFKGDQDKSKKDKTFQEGYKISK